MFGVEKLKWLLMTSLINAMLVCHVLLGNDCMCIQSWPVEVVPRSEWSGWNQLNAPSLPLVEASIRSREGRDLADWLVYNRLAQPSI